MCISEEIGFIYRPFKKKPWIFGGDSWKTFSIYEKEIYKEGWRKKETFYKWKNDFTRDILCSHVDWIAAYTALILNHLFYIPLKYKKLYFQNKVNYLEMNFVIYYQDWFIPWYIFVDVISPERGVFDVERQPSQRFVLSL